jgi:RHS repeat-associated protein
MIALLRQLVAAALSVIVAAPLCASTYDVVGNRTEKVSTIPGYPSGLTDYNAKDLLSADRYDADGNTTASSGVGYVYDFENHLIQAGGGISYVYDGDGNRVSKTVAGVTTKYVVADQNPTGYAQVQEEDDNSGAARQYTYGLELISRWDTNTGLSIYYVHDGHGSVRALADSSGAVTDTYDYDAFGNLLHSTGNTPNNYLFAGEQFDPDLGLYYNRARYLNTSTGRFWSTDTFQGDDQAPLSLHKYLYASADPINRRDPSGHESLAELDISSAINQTLDAISTVQKVIRIKDEISTVLDLLSAIKDLGILLGTQGGGGIINLASQIESEAIDEIGKDAVNLPLQLFESISTNAPRIAKANLLSPAKDAKLARAFSAPDSAILLYLPGVLGKLGNFKTGLKVAGRPLELTSQGGFSLLGMGFAGAGITTQLFHVDLVTPLKPGHSGTEAGDLDAWYDGRWLNYQVPQN